MPSLRDVQLATRRGLLQDAGDDALADIVSAGLTPRQRLSIYRNTMLGTLANALRLSFPAVHRLVGADFFEGAARVFARGQPPRCADLNVYGAEFPDFLQRFEPAATVDYLADVARLEWAVNLALHAQDEPALEPPRLASVAPCDHDRVCFIAHSSISLLRSRFPVDTIWRAVLQHDDTAMAAIDLHEPVYLLVERLVDELDVMRLDEGAWRFASALLGRQPLGVALGLAEGVDASALLAHHLLAGRFVAFHVAIEETAP
jgi:putative DNA-binding protein